MKDLSNLMLNYDKNYDILYVSIGFPVPSYVTEDIDGILIRHSLVGDKLSGVTILDFSQKTKNQLYDAIPFVLDIDKLLEFVHH